MCGICGIVYKDKSKSVKQSLLARMADTLIHRGPDDSGYYLRGNVGFGHRRLSIVDLALGHQPISNEDASLWITYNGEIYNHVALRKELENKGHRYKTNSDTETILHCYEEYGPAGLHKLRGMFAFALHDQKTGGLFIARDRLGIKPLYYIDTPEFFAFASEIKAILTLPEIRRTVDYDALLQILALKYTSDDSTLFEGIKKLEPGFYLELHHGALSITKYWDFNTVVTDSSLSEQDAVAQFGEIFNQSINMRLMADVPLGMFLSGGIDSTVIATQMAGMVSQPISTFSVAFSERDANELHYARLAATHSRAHQYEVTMSTEDFFNSLPSMIYHEDEPIAHPSSIALYWVSKLASQHVKVVLTGEGADELFGGYEKYYQTLKNLKADRLIFAILPRSLRPRLFRPLIDSLPYKFPFKNKATRTSLYLDPSIESLFLDNYATFSRNRLGQLLNHSQSDSGKISHVYEGFLTHFNRYESKSPLSKLLYADMKTYLVELLMKQDQMSMAASIESRVPFLDHNLVEFAFTLPDTLKVKGYQTKRIVRKSFSEKIPDEIMNRPKAGFPVPIKKWFAREYHQTARELILGKDSFCSVNFERPYIEQMFEFHRSGKVNYSDQIWTLLNLELWHQIFIQHIEPASIRLNPR